MAECCTPIDCTLYAGDTALIKLVAEDRHCTLTDPTGLTLTVRDPLGVSIVYVWNTDPQIVQDETGKFVGLVLVPIPGTWYFYWTASGTIAGVEPGQFDVLALPF